MSTDRPDDENGVLGFIAVAVQDLTETVKDMNARMATKEDVQRAETAIRGDVEQVQLRLDGIEKSVVARLAEFDARLARIRSAVYMLAKDRPEVLRVLGE